MTPNTIAKTLEKHQYLGVSKWMMYEGCCFVSCPGHEYRKITYKEAEDAATKYLADDHAKATPKPDREPSASQVSAALESLAGRIAYRGVTSDVDMHFIRAAIEIIKRSQPSPEALLNRLADDVLEAKRYCKSDPDHVGAKIEGFHDRLKDEVGDLVEWKRISDNLYVASERIAVNHELAESYLYGAATELRNAADKARKAADAN